MKKNALLILLLFFSYALCENMDEIGLKGKKASIVYYHSNEVEDYIVVRNKSQRTDVWNLYGLIESVESDARGYNFSLDNYLSGIGEKNWSQLCKTSRMVPKTKEKISSRWIDEIEYMSQYAIYSESGIEYEYKLETHNHDLYLYIYDKGQKIPNKHFEFSIGGIIASICTILTIVFYSIYIPTVMVPIYN